MLAEAAMEVLGICRHIVAQQIDRQVVGEENVSPAIHGKFPNGNSYDVAVSDGCIAGGSDENDCLTVDSLDVFHDTVYFAVPVAMRDRTARSSHGR